MADERYEWLDKDAAEKLLRGEPAASLDGHPGTEAEELAAALAAVARTARPATGELPGEAQALAAFRAAMQPARAVRPGQSERPVRSVEPAQAERPVQSASSASSASSGSVGDAASAGAAGGPEQDDALAPVRIRPVGGVAGAGAAPGPRRPRSPRWGRPLRFGLVASFAGCALGGVAVATGAGMLPGPFGRDAPEPAISVSADASPDGSGSQGVSGTTPSAEPPASPDATSSGPRGGSSAPDDERGTGRAGDGSDRKGDGRKGGADHSSPAAPGSGASGLWYAQALKACRDYRAGDLDADRRRALEALAKGPHNLERYCDRLIGQSAGNGNKGKNGKKGQNGQNGQNGKNGKGGKGGNGQGNENDDQDDQGGKGQNGPGGTVGNNGRDGDEANAFGDGRGPASPVNRFTTGPNPKRPPATPPRGPRAATAVLPPAVSYALGSALSSADRSVTVPVFPAAAGRAAGAGTGSPGADDRRGQGRGTAVPHRV